MSYGNVFDIQTQSKGPWEIAYLKKGIKLDELYEKLYKKHAKWKYKGKPTNRNLNLTNKINILEGHIKF